MKRISHTKIWLTLPWIVSLLIGTGRLQAKFTVVALPDTQNYSRNEMFPDYPNGIAEIYTAQTQWIVENQQAKNIRFVCHLGDIVDSGPDTAQWQVADYAMSILDDAGIPYGTCLGNHDNHYGYGISPDTDPNATDYLAYFGPVRFAGRIWYRGCSPTQRSNYQVIEVEGKKLLFLNLSIDTPQRELDWAQQVLDQNRDKLAILSTHRYIYDFRILEGRYGDGVLGSDTYEETELADEKYDPETIWPEQLFDTFIKTNPNIFLVLFGHCDGQYHQISENDKGLPVIEALADYQDGPNGGNGWMRILEFDFDNGTVAFSAYSPTLGRQRTIVDDFMDTLLIINMYKDSLAEAVGLTELQKQLILAQLRADVPAYTKAPELEAYLQQPDVQAYLTAEGMNYAWDGLWMEAFADGSRDPSFVVAVDFDAYVESEQESLQQDLNQAQIGAGEGFRAGL
ncbi:MAG: metallophosphoesterase, partial [Phycisphaerales bacterium]